MKTVKLVALVGSLRKESLNKALARHIRSLLPEGFVWDEPNISELPFYNEDLQAKNPPEVVTDFQERIRKADALVIVSPEYNWSIPAVIKNAIDWGTRPVPEMPISGKPVFLAGASGSVMGTARMQLALRQVFAFTHNPILNSPDIYVTFAPTKFDSQGNLIDEKTIEIVGKSVATFVDEIQKLL